MLRCANVCHLFDGYRHGCVRYQVNGNKACITCFYQIHTDKIRCPCCRQKYRSKPHYYKDSTRRDVLRQSPRVK